MAGMKPVEMELVGIAVRTEGGREPQGRYTWATREKAQERAVGLVGEDWCGTEVVEASPGTEERKEPHMSQSKCILFSP